MQNRCDQRLMRVGFIFDLLCQYILSTQPILVAAVCMDPMYIPTHPPVCPMAMGVIFMGDSMVARDQPYQVLQALLTGMAAGGEADAGGERFLGDGVIADAVGMQFAHRTGDDGDPETGLHHADGGEHLRALAAETGAETGALAALGDGIV
jgi:hypothetical protein